MQGVFKAVLHIDHRFMFFVNDDGRMLFLGCLYYNNNFYLLCLFPSIKIDCIILIFLNFISLIKYNSN